MPSNSGDFWDERYLAEGEIWGDVPSPTAIIATPLIRPHDRLLDVGFGYGRDMAYYLEHSCRVFGIDLSAEGRRRAEQRLERQHLTAERLWTGAFEEGDFGGEPFDVIHSHRVAHLLVTPQEISAFATKAISILRPGGLLCIGAPNRLDLDDQKMTEIGDGVYEYAARPGHRIRYWDDRVFTDTFGGAFEILELEQAVEIESLDHPVPCRFSVMIGRRKEDA